MKKERHISEFSAKKGDGLHIRVTTTREGRRIAVDGGRLYFKDYPTKSACMLQARKIRDDILRSLDTKPTHSPTVRELFERSYDLFPIAMTTRSQHEARFERYLSDCADTPITRLTLQDVQMTVTRYAETHADETIKRITALWRRIYRTASFMEVSVVDYSVMIIPPRSNVIVDRRDMSLDVSSLEAMTDELSRLKSWKAKTALSVVWVMYYTGMRTGEALGLRVSDVDLVRGLIHVRQAVGATTLKRADIKPLKTRQSARDIPIADGLRPVLMDALGMSDNDLGLLYSTPEGEPLDPETVNDYVAGRARIIGVKFSLYRLRHMFSADLFREGVNPKIVQSLMGHENENMSLYYAYVTEDERAEAVNRRKPS